MIKKHILIFAEYFPSLDEDEITGGVESRSYYLAKELAKKHQVTVVTTAQNGQVRERKGNLTVVRACQLKYSRTERYLQRILNSVPYFVTAVVEKRKIGFALVDGHNFFTYFVSAFMARILSVPSVVTYHEVWVGNWIKNTGKLAGIIGEIAERFILFWLKFNKTKFISVSNFTKQKLIDAGVRARDITVIPNGVNVSDFTKIKVKKAKQPTISCIARLSPNKRVEDLIKAVAIVKKEIPNIKCKIIGGGEEREKLEKLIQELNLQQNVQLMGRVKSNQKVREIMKSSHVFCLPSVLEGFGIVVAEAMASRVPYVCTDIPPLVEVTQNGKGGLIYKAKDHKDLASKLLRLLQDKKLYSKKVNECKALVKNYDWKIIAKKLERYYLGLIK
ncbi:MAG: glycosyltransferase family 4 protein [Nanoarchaeota archaeon]|nr:glycosyltransferase family 4 protein [Nanoarchaeota archaeon]